MPPISIQIRDVMLIGCPVQAHTDLRLQLLIHHVATNRVVTAPLELDREGLRPFLAPPTPRERQIGQ